VSSLRFPIAVLLLYAWLFPWLPALRSPNELCRLYQIRAIVDDHSLSVNGVIERRGPVGDLSVRDGRYYPSKAPGMSLLGVPVYAALEMVRGGAQRVPDRAAIFFLRLFVCMIPGAAAAEMLRRILARRFAPAVAFAGATVYALGTILWPYSTLFMSHGPTTAALVACWYFLDRARRHPDSPAHVRGARIAGLADDTRHGSYALAGLFAGAAVALEYTSALALPLLAGYGLAGARRKLRASLHALAGFLPPVLALALYHQVAFGSPFDTGYRHLASPYFAAWHARGFMGVAVPHLRSLAEAFVLPARGLFAYSPFLALALPGLPLLWGRDRALALLCGAALAAYALFAASFAGDTWGWTVGPRHIAALSAFLLPPALEAAEWLRNRGIGIFAAALALASIWGMALVVATCPYLPEELTNPVHQLSVPLLVMGLRSHDLLGMALGTSSILTLLPWVGLLAWMSVQACLPFLSKGPASLRAANILGAAMLGAVLFNAGALVGGPDHFDRMRQLIVDRFEPRGRYAPGVFDPP
jgi:hypothetical protein